MKDLLFAGALALGLSLTGCGASQYLGNTSATANRDGFSYNSNKNQENLHAVGQIDPATGAMNFDVSTTASTPDAAIAAALQSNLEAQKQLSTILQAIAPLIAAAAKAAVVAK